MHVDHAQFVEVPPLEHIKEFFKVATGIVFKLGDSWKSWPTLDPDDVLVFMPYIRPCHQKLLMETANGKNPCAFLRQLLRPYKYTILLHKNTFSLQEIKEELKTVGKKDGATVTWMG